VEDRAVSELRFAHPLFLWALAALPFLAALIFHAEKSRRIALDRLIAVRLQPRLAGSVSVARRRWGYALVLLGLALAVVALARPQWGFTWEEKRQSGRDIMFAIDTSKSMLATDLLPNRLTRAKLAAEDLLNQLEGDRVGLLAFAGSSFLQAPLTSDFGAVRDSLQELDTDIIPRGGTNLAEAIKAAEEAFGKGEGEHRALIIFSDGEELEADAIMAARAAKDRFHIFTVGLGSPEGSLVPITDGKGGGTEFLRDDQGQYVKSKLDEPRLREVAEAGGGFYVALQNGPAEMQRIVREGLGKMKERETDARFSRVPIERYHWPLAAAIAAIATALLLGERRRVRTARIAAAALVLLGARAEARHEGIEKFEAKDYAGSLGVFDSELKKRERAELHFDAGAAAYQLGDYARAADAFSKALGTAPAELKNRAAYHLANTLARRGVKHEKKEDKIGDLKDAVKQYDEVLNAEPNYEDAKHNRDIVNKLIAQLEEEQKQEKEDEKKDQKKDDKDKKDQEKKDQQDKQDSSQGGKDDQQQKNSDGSPKDGSGKDPKDDKKDQEKSKDGGKDDQQKDGQEKKDSQQQKSDGQQKDGKDEPGAKKDAQQQSPDDKPGDKPQPQPKDGGDDKQKSGEVKAANPGQQEPGKQDPAAEAAEAAQAAQEGRMTEKDAAQILEALKRFDRRVRLLDPKDEPVKNPNRPFKNW
jgi:Ca-activated chloride channel family protein